MATKKALLGAQGLDANGQPIVNASNITASNTITAQTFSGSGASLTNIPNSALNNSSITINSTPVSLGGSITVSATDSSKLPLAGGTLTGSLSGTSASFSSSVTASSLIKSGGISSQFLKADGSVDANTYYLASNPSGYITSTATITGDARNITQYAINQNLSTTSSPTFSGLTVDTNTLFVDATNDRVGVGTVSPAYKVHIEPTTITAGGVNNLLRIGTQNTTTGTISRFSMFCSSDPVSDANGGKVFIDAIRTATNMDLSFSLNDGAGAGPLEKMRLTGAGNLGLGNASPTFKLQVEGNVYANGSVLARSLRSSGRGELFLNASGSSDVSEILFGYGNGYNENNIRWGISDRGNGVLAIYKGPAHSGWAELVTLTAGSPNSMVIWANTTINGTLNATGSITQNGSQVLTASNLLNYAQSTTEWYHSNRDFVNGTLITTSIDYSVTNGDPFILEIRGNSYGNLIPFSIQIQGYIYNNTIINYGGYSIGGAFNIIAMNVGGNLCFWFSRQAYWQGFNVKCYIALPTRALNKVTSITDVVEPTAGTKKVTITPTQVLRSDNYSSYALPLSGGTISGNLSVTGTLNASSTLSQGGNQVLHAGNYSSYALPLSGGVVTGSTYYRKNQTDGAYTSASLWTESYGNTTTGIAFHISGVVGKFLEMRTNGTLYFDNNTMIHSGNYSSYVNYGNPNTRGVYQISNWNQTTYPNAHFLSGEGNIANSPTTDFHYGIQTSFHRDGSAYRTQLVTSLYSDTNIYVRNSRDSDVWTSWKLLLHSGNYSSYAIPNSGSWLGDLGSYGFTRYAGMSMSGGSEVVFLYKGGQGYTLIDGNYMAFEGGGFYSSYNSSGGTLIGMKAIATNTLELNARTSIRRSAYTVGANDFFMELIAPDDGSGSGEIGLRFHLENRYWRQIRANSGGFVFTQGGDNNTVPITASNVIAQNEVSATNGMTHYGGNRIPRTIVSTSTPGGTINDGDVWLQY